MIEEKIKANPNPEFLIKSISEQGYTLETALADLIDNSITANASRIEILTYWEDNKQSLFLVDNGDGMNYLKLEQCMMFPSSNLEEDRLKNDLGRFGLGLKTASFSQTRKFTIISKQKVDDKNSFNALTWDVDKLNSETGWIIFKENKSSINKLIQLYIGYSSNFIEHSENFIQTFNTMIHWENMRKFTNNESFFLQLELVKEYLGIVFHHYIDKKKITIRFNGEIIESFNPFPIDGGGLMMDESQYFDLKNNFKMKGYIVNPDFKENERKWTTKYRSLFDLEGVYIYRNDRLIFFGGWNGLRKRSSKLKLARLKIDFENSNDNFFLLNIDKSKVTIPYAAKRSVIEYVEKLENIAIKQFYNKKIDGIATKEPTNKELIIRNSNNKGRYIDFNKNFPILKDLENTLNPEQNSKLKLILKMIKVAVNKITETHEDFNIITIDDNKSEIKRDDIVRMIRSFEKINWNHNEIEKFIMQNLGYEKSEIIKQIIKETIN
jgi:hypothetical protein